jgi:uncharacterized membrane protein
MKQRLTLLIGLAGVGVAVSLYLLTVHWGWQQAVCLGVGDCESVNQSRYSELLGIPVALLGALTYCVFIVCSVLIARGVMADGLRRAQFFIAAVGVAFSAYLTAIEVFVLQTICPWCVLSAILMVLIAILSAWELMAS